MQPPPIPSAPEPILHPNPIRADLPPPTAPLLLPDAPFEWPDHYDGTQGEAMEAGYCPSCLGNGQPAVGQRCASCAGYGTAAAYDEVVRSHRPANPH